MDLSLRAWQSLLKNTGYIIPPNHHLSKLYAPFLYTNGFGSVWFYGV